MCKAVHRGEKATKALWELRLRQPKRTLALVGVAGEPWEKSGREAALVAAGLSGAAGRYAGIDR